MMTIDQLSPTPNRRFEESTNTDSVADRLRDAKTEIEKAAILSEITAGKKVIVNVQGTEKNDTVKTLRLRKIKHKNEKHVLGEIGALGEGTELEILDATYLTTEEDPNKEHLWYKVKIIKAGKGSRLFGETEGYVSAEYIRLDFSTVVTKSASKSPQRAVSPVPNPAPNRTSRPQHTLPQAATPSRTDHAPNITPAPGQAPNPVPSQSTEAPIPPRTPETSEALTLNERLYPGLGAMLLRLIPTDITERNRIITFINENPDIIVTEYRTDQSKIERDLSLVVPEYNGGKLGKTVFLPQEGKIRLKKQGQETNYDSEINKVELRGKELTFSLELPPNDPNLWDRSIITFQPESYHNSNQELEEIVGNLAPVGQKEAIKEFLKTHQDDAKITETKIYDSMGVLNTHDQFTGIMLHEIAFRDGKMILPIPPNNTGSRIIGIRKDGNDIFIKTEGEDAEQSIEYKFTGYG